MSEFSGIMAIHSGALGDVILLARLLESTSLPATLVAKKSYAQLLAGLGRVEKILDFDSLPMHEIFSDTPVEQCKLTNLLGGRDLLVSCFATGQATAQRRLAEICGVRRSVFLPIMPTAEYPGHLLDFWRDIAPDIFSKPKSPSASWAVPTEFVTIGNEQLRKIGVESGKLVLIHPGSGSSNKNWPVENFLNLASRLINAGRQIVFVLGPVELDCWDRHTLESITAQFSTLMNPSLEALAGVMSLAEQYIGNDSGATHLAAAIGVPVIAVFMGSDARHFSPQGQFVKVFPCPRQSELTVDEIFRTCSQIS